MAVFCLSNKVSCAKQPWLREFLPNLLPVNTNFDHWFGYWGELSNQTHKHFATGSTVGVTCVTISTRRFLAISSAAFCLLVFFPAALCFLIVFPTPRGFSRFSSDILFLSGRPSGCRCPGVSRLRLLSLGGAHACCRELHLTQKHVGVTSPCGCCLWLTDTQAEVLVWGVTGYSQRFWSRLEVAETSTKPPVASSYRNALSYVCRVSVSLILEAKDEMRGGGVGVNGEAWARTCANTKCEFIEVSVRGSSNSPGKYVALTWRVCQKLENFVCHLESRFTHTFILLGFRKALYWHHEKSGIVLIVFCSWPLRELLPSRVPHTTSLLCLKPT